MENPIIYDKDCKRWAIALSVCVDAMGDYTPMCHIYIQIWIISRVLTIEII
ncbi:MAG: hypothetical protein ACLT9Y_03710 [Peptostreptococcus anaerobius]